MNISKIKNAILTKSFRESTGQEVVGLSDNLKMIATGIPTTIFLGATSVTMAKDAKESWKDGDKGDALITGALSVLMGTLSVGVGFYTLVSAHDAVTGTKRYYTPTK